MARSTRIAQDRSDRPFDQTFLDRVGDRACVCLHYVLGHVEAADRWRVQVWVRGKTGECGADVGTSTKGWSSL